MLTHFEPFSCSQIFLGLPKTQYLPSIHVPYLTNGSTQSVIPSINPKNPGASSEYNPIHIPSSILPINVNTSLKSSSFVIVAKSEPNLS